jgi:hypothetical protein
MQAAPAHGAAAETKGAGGSEGKAPTEAFKGEPAGADTAAAAAAGVEAVEGSAAEAGAAGRVVEPPPPQADNSTSMAEQEKRAIWEGANKFMSDQILSGREIAVA